MLKDKYNMTTEENVLYAKRNMVDSIWKSANLEGISVTFSEAQAIYDGANVGHLRIDEIQAINNLKHAWQFDYLIFVKTFFINLLYYFFVWQTSENDIFFKKLYLFHFFYDKIQL